MNRTNDYFIIDLDTTKFEYKCILPFIRAVQQVVLVGDFYKYRNIVNDENEHGIQKINKKDFIMHHEGFSDVINGLMVRIGNDMRDGKIISNTPIRLFVITQNTERYEEYTRSSNISCLTIKVQKRLPAALRQRQKSR